MRSHLRQTWLLLGLLALPACTRRPPETIARVVGATARRGPWVPPSGYEFFVRAELQAEQGAFQSAVELYERARSGIDDPYVRAREADAALHIPNVQLATSLVEEGLRDTPDSEALLLVRARIAALSHDDALEESSLRQAVAAAPLSTESLFALTHFLEAHAREEEAIALLDQFASARTSDTSLERARLVAVLRAELARAVLMHDVARGGRVARQLVTLSPVHRPEILQFALQAQASHEPLLAHAVLRALPIQTRELGLRFEVALAAHDGSAAEAIALAFDDGTPAGALASAARWLALGDSERAEETANGVWLVTRDTEARTLMLRARLARNDLHGALALLDAAPLADAWPSASPADRSALCEALVVGALPALAREVCPPIAEPAPH